MRQDDILSLWRKAAVLGSLWAASEIVLGSFLHNARIPLRGHILTAIGIIILVAGHRLWPKPGLLWRAGLVCAAMKSISPSAVIFGPMLAIFMEGILLELGVFLIGANPIGCIFGGGLAMSWPLFHNVANLLIFYGPATVDAYVKAWKYLQAWAGFHTSSVWVPLVMLWVAHFMAGCVSAAIGLGAGQERNATFRPRPAGTVPVSPMACRNAAYGKTSLAVLMLHLIFVSVVTSLGHKFNAWYLAAGSAIYAAICASTCPRAAAILKRRGVWLGMLTISMFAGLLLGSLEIGIQMAVRAFILTLGFSAIGEELRNPSIRFWLERCFGRRFFDTLEHAFGTLPEILANLPSGSEMAHRPLASIRRGIAFAPIWLDALKERRVFIVTGGHGAGKTLLVREMSSALLKLGMRPGGVCSIGIRRNSSLYGFDVTDILSQEKAELCRRNGPKTGTSVGPFQFNLEGLTMGQKALSMSRLEQADIVFIDEVGFLELEGEGWGRSLDILTRQWRKPMVIVVRNYLVDKVCQRWDLHYATVWDIRRIKFDSTLTVLIEAIRDIRT